MRISDWSSDVCSSDLVGVGFVAVDQLPAAGLDAAGQRRLAVEAVAQERRPVAFHHALERGDHVVEGVGVLRPPLPVVAAEERMREIVQRLLPATELANARVGFQPRSEEHTSELQSLMRISYAVFCLKKKKQ